MAPFAARFPSASPPGDGSPALSSRILLVIVAGIATAPVWAPETLRRLVIARLETISRRPVEVDAVELDLWRRPRQPARRPAARAGRGRRTPGSRSPRSIGSISTCESCRWRSGACACARPCSADRPCAWCGRPDGDFNFSDLLRGPATVARPLDLEVERFSLRGGTVVLVDRALAEPRTWTSERIEIDARDVSTRHARGSVTGRSVTAGAPVTIEVTKLRLHPVELQATVVSEGVDLALTDVYLPPDAPVRLAGGRATTRLTVALHARDGLTADATGRFEDVVIAPAGGGEPLAVVPALTAELGGFGFRDGAVRVARLSADGTMSVRDPTARAGSPSGSPPCAPEWRT